MSYVRFMLAELNRDNGAFAFEGLARDLIHAEYCSNIVPATGPVAGGDRGEDSRTHRTYLTESDDRLRLYEGFAGPVDERIIFAFSIRQDWQAKIRDDVAKIIANGLAPDKIVFATNQPVPIRERQDAERELHATHGCPVEILDATWFVQHLERKHYALAVRHLKCDPRPEEQMQRMLERTLGFRDAVLPEAESHEIRILIESVRYRSAYLHREHLVLDLKRIADIYANYAEHTDDAARFYEEALYEARRAADELLPPVLPDVLYAYFKLLFKVPARRREIFRHLPELRDHIVAWGHTSYLWNVNVWTYSLSPEFADDPDFLAFLRETHSCFERWDRKGLTPTSAARVLDAEIAAYLCLKLCETRRLDEDYLFTRMPELLDLIDDAPFFDIVTLARRIAVFAPAVTREEEYEYLYDRAEALAARVMSDGERGVLRCERGLRLFKAGDFQRAADQFRLAKVFYETFNAVRPRICVCLTLGKCYDALGAYYAAEWEFLQAINLALMLPDNLHKDLATVAFQELYGVCLKDGRLLSSLAYARLYLMTRQAWRMKTRNAGGAGPGNEDGRVSSDEAFVTQIDQNMVLVLGSLYASNRRLHDAGLALLLQMMPAEDSIYLDLVRGTPDQLRDIYASDLRTLETMLRVYDEMREGTLAGPNNIAPLQDEDAGRMTTSFQVSGLAFEADFDTEYRCRLVAQTVLTSLQHLFIACEPFLRELAWAEEKVTLHFYWQDGSDASPMDEALDIEEIPNGDLLELRVTMTDAAYEDCVRSRERGYLAATLGIWTHIVNLCTLDPSEDIWGIPNNIPAAEQVIRNFLATPSYASLVKTYLGADDPRWRIPGMIDGEDTPR